MKHKNWLPALVLFFLAPAIGELLSGSSPPMEFFNPIAFVMLTVSYGGSALLIRELAFRWKKGWNSIFILGIAYAFVNEGLSAKSFFDPNWVDAGILGSYGRLAGVNWVWLFGLVVYHTIISMSIPILIVSMLFPKLNSVPWISKRMFGALTFLVIADTFFINLVVSKFIAPIIHLLAAIALIAGLIIIAKHAKEKKIIAKKFSIPKPIWFWLAGFLAAFAFFLIFYEFPKSGINPLIDILIMAAEILISVFLVYRMSYGFSAWQDKHKFALSAGVLSCLIAFTPVIEFQMSMKGMTAVGIVFAFFLVWIYRKIKKENQSKL